MTRMFNPPHPGLTLRDDVLPALGLGVTQSAEQLGVSRVALSRVLNGRAAIHCAFRGTPSRFICCWKLPTLPGKSDQLRVRLCRPGQ